MIYAAEYALPGHPDKLCDAIADALVEEAARREKRALCAIEVAVHRASVFVTGRIACRRARPIPVREIVRECYRAAGYGADWRPSPEELDVRTNLCLGPLLDGEAGFREVSDDQSIVTGYAIDSPGTNYSGTTRTDLISNAISLVVRATAAISSSITAADSPSKGNTKVKSAFLPAGRIGDLF